MATLPPPYSQRDAVRAQRYYQRSLRRPSMLGPVVLIVIGVLALLVETNTLSFVHVWDWYMQWWPLLLVAVGLLSLGEWYLDRHRGQSGAALSRGTDCAHHRACRRRLYGWLRLPRLARHACVPPRLRPG